MLPVNYDDNGELEKIAPFNRMGGWTIKHPFHYKGARRYYEEYKSLEEVFLQEKEKAISERGEDFLYTDKSILEIENDLNLLSHNIVLYTCMCIEGFINYYGVRRMGEVFYKRNLERLGITEKLQIILLSCTGHLCKKDENIIKIVRSIFDIRNSLIHPKSKDITVSGSFIPSSHDFSEQEIIEQLDKFFLLFYEFDNDLKSEISMLQIAL